MNKKLIFYIWGFFLLVIFLLYFFIQKYTDIDEYLFKYPNFPINFAWEEMPVDSSHFSNKEKFDREFIVTSNTIYQFYLYVKRYPTYIPYIESKLKEKWIPDDFKYLSIVESALRNDIVSHAWAWWIWQFMPETAKQYGLIVDEFVDERYNFEKSTDAALEYINNIYTDLKNRTLVAASYNRWENAIKRILKEQNADNYYDLYLNQETWRYVFKILAVKYIMKNYMEHKKIIDKIVWVPDKIPETKIIREEKIDDLVIWAWEHWQSYNNIKLLNSWIIWNSLPKWVWEIKILE